MASLLSKEKGGNCFDQNPEIFKERSIFDIADIQFDLFREIDFVTISNLPEIPLSFAHLPEARDPWFDVESVSI